MTPAMRDGVLIVLLLTGCGGWVAFMVTARRLCTVRDQLAEAAAGWRRAADRAQRAQAAAADRDALRAQLSRLRRRVGVAEPQLPVIPVRLRPAVPPDLSALDSQPPTRVLLTGGRDAFDAEFEQLVSRWWST